MCHRFIRILIVTSWSEKTLEAEAPVLQPPSADLYLFISPPNCRGCFRVAVSIYVHDALRQFFDRGSVCAEGG